MRIDFLGTGSSLGIPVITCGCEVCASTNSRDKRLRTSVFVQIDDLNILIDVGPDFRLQAMKAGIHRIDAVLLTHEHNDHIGGLDDLRPFNYKQKEPIKIYCSERVKGVLENSLKYVFGKDKYPGIPELDIHLINDEPFEIKGVRIVPVLATHYKTECFELPVTGFRIQNFTYLTDVRFIEESELQKVTGTHTLILSTLKQEDHYSHLNITEAMKIVGYVKPQKTYFTHISHLMGKHVDVESKLPGFVYLAYDGLEINIG